jgi:hypothetical protein
MNQTQSAINTFETLADLPVANPLVPCRAMWHDVEVNVLEIKTNLSNETFARIETCDGARSFPFRHYIGGEGWKTYWTNTCEVPTEEVIIIRPEIEA